MMTDNKRVTNKQLQEQLKKLIKKFNTMDVTIKLDEEDLNILATKTVSRMVKLKAMEDWFDHVNESDIAWSTSYKDLKLTEEENALGEAAKLMTLMEMFKQNEEYEKCAIIKNRMNEVNKILRRYK
jgi:vacuolar-type H+-ATPase subunit E/Vma4